MVWNVFVQRRVSGPGDPKKCSCLSKCKTHNKRGIFKIKIVLNYHRTNLKFDILILIFGCYLDEI